MKVGEKWPCPDPDSNPRFIRVDKTVAKCSRSLLTAQPEPLPRPRVQSREKVPRSDPGSNPRLVGRKQKKIYCSHPDSNRGFNRVKVTS